MKIKDVLNQDELDTLKMHENWFGNVSPEWLLDSLIWKGKDLDIRDFALLYIAQQLEKMNTDPEF